MEPGDIGINSDEMIDPTRFTVNNQNPNPEPGTQQTSINPQDELNLSNLEMLLSNQADLSNTEIAIENSIDDFDISALPN